MGMSPSIGGAADAASDTASRNVKPGLAGAIGIAAGSSILGGSAGPVVGSLAAASMLDDDSDSDNVMQTGMMLAGYHLATTDIRGGGANTRRRTK